jgi:hypothetical protein
LSATPSRVLHDRFERIKEYRADTKYEQGTWRRKLGLLLPNGSHAEGAMLCTLAAQPDGSNTKVEITVEVPDGVVFSHAGQFLKRYLDESFAEAEVRIDEYLATLEPPCVPKPYGGLAIVKSVESQT